MNVADASILVDNSRTIRQAFAVCSVQIGDEEVFDRRRLKSKTPKAILSWLDIVAPLP